MKSLREKKKEISSEERKWQVEKDIIERKNKIRNEKQQLKIKNKKPTTTKLLVFFLFLNCTAIELFTGYITIQSLLLAQQTLTTPDFTPLISLIGAVVGETIGFAIYSIKSAKENCANGITYEATMYELKNKPNDNENIVG